jgi:hypothetical protein
MKTIHAGYEFRRLNGLAAYIFRHTRGSISLHPEFMRIARVVAHGNTFNRGYRNAPIDLKQCPILSVPALLSHKGNMMTAFAAYGLGQRPSVIAGAPIFCLTHRTAATEAEQSAAQKLKHRCALYVEEPTLQLIAKKAAVPQDAIEQRGKPHLRGLAAAPLTGRTHRSTVALGWSLSSGVARSFAREVALGPEAIATCLPPPRTSSAARTRRQGLIFHSWSREVSPNAATLPSRATRSGSLVTNSQAVRGNMKELGPRAAGNRGGLAGCDNACRPAGGRNDQIAPERRAAVGGLAAVLRVHVPDDASNVPGGGVYLREHAPGIRDIQEPVLVERRRLDEFLAVVPASGTA